MSDILFIRHAETDMAGTFCGHSDPELNALGHEQVSQLIDRLREEKIGMVYTSDLHRAHSTAKAIAASFAIDCEVRPGLREIDFGSWEGLTWNEIEKQDKVYVRRWVEQHPDLAAPGGELFSDFERRAIAEIEFLSTRAIGRDIAVVTHGGVMRVVLRAVLGFSNEDAWKQPIPYCAVVRRTSVEPLLSVSCEVAR